MKQSRVDLTINGVIVVFIVLVLISMVYPLYFTVIASISDPSAVALGQVLLLPKQITLDAYRNVFQNSAIWVGYRNSLFYTVFGTVFNLFLTIPTAYALSKKYIPGHNVITWVFLIPMYFGGGLVPTYLLIDSLGLRDKPYTLIFLGGISIYNLVVTRAFFQNSIPQELYDAGAIDGANDFKQFFRLALPLSAPIIAVMALYYGVGHWNNYYTALIYLSKAQYSPLQLILRAILIQNQTMMAMFDDPVLLAQLSEQDISDMMRKTHMAQGMKYSLIFIASGPLLVAYPFVQKYFVKGVMIGALKG